MLVVLRQCHGAEDFDLRFPAHIHAGTMHDQDFGHYVFLSIG
jgi:hypothetical protein